MEIEKTGISELLKSEHRLVMQAPDRYGAYFEHALESSFLLSNFVKSMKAYDTLAAFLSVMKKHHLLAVFSTVRLHRVQAMMNLRQFIEASADAAFAIQDPYPHNFVVEIEDGLLDAPQKLRKKRYAWLEANFPGPSTSLKEVKDMINDSTAHASLIYAQANFRKVEKARFDAPFFDMDDEYFTKADLWLAGKCALTALDLFFGVNMAPKTIIFSDDFGRQFASLVDQNVKLRAETMSDERFKKQENR